MNIDNLNPEQSYAVKNYAGPMLIIAGAGSGKTRVITYRIANMLNHNVRQKNILALTFTVKAAQEMKQRVEAIFNRKLRDLDITNFHSFGCEVLRKHIHKIGFKTNFSIYDMVDQIYVLKSTLFEMGEEISNYSLPDMLKTFSDIKTSRLEKKDVGEKYREIYDEYIEYLRICNAVDFDDLIYLPLRLFDEFPEILLEYQQRYQYVLVDEFQDTSLDQYKLIYKISQNHQNICVVGDDDQSIYSFRGANYQNIVSFEDDFPQRHLVKLEQNYRSSKQILDIANHLIKNNTNRKDKTLWSDKQAQNTKLYNHKTEYDEIAFLIDDIKLKKFENNYKFLDFAVLVRTNTIITKIEEEFIQNKIPYYISGGFSFFDKAEIKDMICYMRYILNPLDDASLIRVINKPRRNIGKVSLQKITSLSKKKALPVYRILTEIKAGSIDVDAMDLRQNAIDGVCQFLSLIDEFKAKLLSNKNFAITLNSLITELDYNKYLTDQFGLKDNIAKFKMQNVRKFIDMLDRYEKNPDNFEAVDIYRYITNIALSSYVKEDRIKDKDKVGILTIHSAKGLEWENVYIVAVEDGILPHQKSISENLNETGAMEEERRLFYVALTRAKTNLTLSYCNSRKSSSNKQETKYPSPFLNELPIDLLEKKEYTSNEIVSPDEILQMKKAWEEKLKNG